MCLYSTDPLEAAVRLRPSGGSASPFTKRSNAFRESNVTYTRPFRYHIRLSVELTAAVMHSYDLVRHQWPAWQVSRILSMFQLNSSRRHRVGSAGMMHGAFGSGYYVQ